MPALPPVITTFLFVIVEVLILYEKEALGFL
jgi:hypothetical protein